MNQSRNVLSRAEAILKRNSSRPVIASPVDDEISISTISSSSDANSFLMALKENNKRNEADLPNNWLKKSNEKEIKELQINAKTESDTNSSKSKLEDVLDFSGVDSIESLSIIADSIDKISFTESFAEESVESISEHISNAESLPVSSIAESIASLSLSDQLVEINSPQPGKEPIEVENTEIYQYEDDFETASNIEPNEEDSIPSVASTPKPTKLNPISDYKEPSVPIRFTTTDNESPKPQSFTTRDNESSKRVPIIETIPNLENNDNFPGYLRNAHILIPLYRETLPIAKEKVKPAESTNKSTTSTAVQTTFNIDNVPNVAVKKPFSHQIIDGFVSSHLQLLQEFVEMNREMVENDTDLVFHEYTTLAATKEYLKQHRFNY